MARAVCDMLEHERAEQVIGWPEKLFARINALLPRVVDAALVRHARAIRQLASKPHEDASPLAAYIQEKTP